MLSGSSSGGAGDCSGFNNPLNKIKQPFNKIGLHRELPQQRKSRLAQSQQQPVAYSPEFDQAWQQSNIKQSPSEPQQQQQQQQHGELQGKQPLRNVSGDWNQEFAGMRFDNPDVNLEQFRDYDFQSSIPAPSSLYQSRSTDFVDEFSSYQLPSAQQLTQKEMQISQTLDRIWDQSLDPKSLQSGSQKQWSEQEINQRLDEMESTWQEAQKIDHQMEQLERAWQDLKLQDNQFADGYDDEFGFNQAWANANGEALMSQPNWDQATDTFGSMANKYKDMDYVFEQDNPFLTHQDPYGEGMRLQKEASASLTTIALAYEAAVQKDLQNSDAWLQLGLVQAENEKEDPAIVALQKAVNADPGNLQALLALAVSYTNEGLDDQAFGVLKQWISHKYRQDVLQLAPDLLQDDTNLPIYEVYDSLSNAYLKIARKQQNNALDPELQIGLAILFYNTGQFDKSIDCFRLALQLRPDDYLLWNRLGATLANSGKSEEAIAAYDRALEIKPQFIRARYNLGVSCMNIGCYKEAAEHFLSALNVHNDYKSIKLSGNMWETLRRTFSLMGRHDLVQLASDGADLSLFRSEFDFQQQ
ncbi:hypothetical protein MP228_009777 [Amoeboaphelidium protococcarum]|nr:hypothetical protein MP228_009777 [Amoeboaphelidium protococcarum]